MRVTHVTAAIVLRNRPFGESDKIVAFFTEKFGKITGIAKGAMRSRKRFVNSLEPFALVDLRFQDPPHSNLAFIVAADVITSHRRLLTSLERISYGSYLLEISDGLLAERQENPAIFDHLKQGLNYLEENNPSLRFLTSYELKLLSLVGYRPVLDSCKQCRKNAGDGGGFQWHFSPIDGGILCDVCSYTRKEILPLGSVAVKVLATLQAERSLPVEFSLPLSVVREIRAAILHFIQFHIDREIKSASFLSNFCPV